MTGGNTLNWAEIKDTAVSFGRLLWDRWGWKRTKKISVPLTYELPGATVTEVTSATTQYPTTAKGFWDMYLNRPRR